MRQVRETLLPLLDDLEKDAPAGLRLLIEPTAGGGEALAATVDDLGAYFAALDGHPRLGVCLDTCHAYAAGHDLARPGGVRKMLNALVRVVGKGRLGLVHANDSKDPLGSGRDRHAPIGVGTIGVDPFAELFVHPAMRGRARGGRDARRRAAARDRRAGAATVARLGALSGYVPDLGSART